MSNKYLVGGNTINGQVYHTFAGGTYVYRKRDTPSAVITGGVTGYLYTIDPDHSYIPQRIQDSDVTFQTDGLTPDLTPYTITTPQGSTAVVFTTDEQVPATLPNAVTPDLMADY